MEFLYFLRDISNPVFDFFFSLITHIGEETFFLVFALVFFWCVSKREGYYILVTGLVGTTINQGLKLACKVDRPWIKDRSFKPYEGAIAEATGYSFPSGHTQNVSGTFGAIAAFAKRNWLRITSLAIIILVSFSRMYLGVHTPLDVGVSLLIGGVLVMGFYPMFKTEDRFNKCMPFIVGGCFLLSLGLLIYVNLHTNLGLDLAGLENLASARENAATLFGCMLGLVLVYPIDRFLIKFETDAKWYSQVIKLVLGLAGVLLLKEGLKMPLNWIFDLMLDDGAEEVARAIRYFIVVAFAGAVWPLSFKAFSRLTIKPFDKFTVFLVTRVFKREAPAKYLPVLTGSSGDGLDSSDNYDGE